MGERSILPTIVGQSCLQHIGDDFAGLLHESMGLVAHVYLSNGFGQHGSGIGLLGSLFFHLLGG